MNRIRDKLVLITGASSGIGEACARAFASFGANLILCARRGDRISALKEELERDHGIGIRTQEIDVRDPDAIQEFVESLDAEGQVPDVLVNNAGKALGLDLFHEADMADWEEMIDTNVKGLLYVSRAVLPLMVERNSGHIVNIGSIAGRQVYQKGAVYNASKFAVRAINEGMALDLVGTKIRVSSVGKRQEGRRSHQIFEASSMMPRSTSTPVIRSNAAQEVSWGGRPVRGRLSKTVSR